ncbi:hypothetical protein Pan97_51300 [Bremerella volcania]|uniref:Uncharacterized protein n=1 Tax=Bremerella volcania TaxID=2527984 RepID=A0A518CFP6_9BACT|nr:hypothetical protein [Bremerella volcania]QDU78050.1 hypothetical protein Pan97_51300 [Bremerella volcania]
MFIVLLFAVLNLAVGFAAAVLLGYGPQPWYALFLPSNRDNTVQIDAIDSDEETEAEKPDAEPASTAVNQPFPEMNEPEDMPPEPEPVPEAEPEIEESFEPVAEQAPQSPVNESNVTGDEDNELEEFLAGRKDETKGFQQDEPASEESAEIASADDIESMFAASQASDDEESSSEDVAAQGDSEEEDELDDEPLGQDDIAALFNS